MGERYFKNRITVSIIALAAYIICVVSDIRFLVKWKRYGESGNAFMLFILLMLLHAVFLILSIKWFRQRNKMKTEDAEASGKKSPYDAFLGLFILGLVAVFSINTANTMVSYVYKSRNGTYDKDISDFKAGASINISSDDLMNGVWDSSITNTSSGRNESPQLSFDKVEGASYYVIYMVDESANNWVHWYAEVTEPGLDHGANEGDYIGPYPPEGSGDHTYAIYVYAMSDKPGSDYDGQYPEFDEPWFGGDTLWTFLNIKDGSARPTLYGNVISYGYIEGTYSR